MGNNFVAMVFAVLKEHGLDTANMSVDEAIAKFNKLRGNRQNQTDFFSGEEQGEPDEDFFAAEEDLTQDTYRGKLNMRQKAQRLKGKPQGTYDLATGEPISFDDGYQVSFQQTSDIYTDDEYDEKVKEMISLTGSPAYAGVFGGEPEASFHTDNLDVAMSIAKDYNQHSILDWRNINDIEKAFIRNPYYDERKNKINRGNDDEKISR